MNVLLVFMNVVFTCVYIHKCAVGVLKCGYSYMWYSDVFIFMNVFWLFMNVGIHEFGIPMVDLV